MSELETTLKLFFFPKQLSTLRHCCQESWSFDWLLGLNAMNKRRKNWARPSKMNSWNWSIVLLARSNNYPWA